MQDIRNSALEDHRISVPRLDCALALSAVVTPVLDFDLNLNSQKADLEKAREILLPRLMYGKIDVLGLRLPEEIAE